MIKPSRRRLLVSVAASLARFASICSAADQPHVYPPLQIFKDFCLASWSLEQVAQMATQQHLSVISSENVPTPDLPAAKRIWEAQTVIGPIGVIGIEGESKIHGHTFTCSVTSPTDSTDFIRSWLKSSFGEPSSTLNLPDNATEFHWMHQFENGKVDVALLTRLPNENHAMLSVTKHEDSEARPKNR